MGGKRYKSVIYYSDETYRQCYCSCSQLYQSKKIGKNYIVYELKGDTSVHMVQQQFFNLKFEQKMEMAVFIFLKSRRVAVSIETTG